MTKNLTLTSNSIFRARKRAGYFRWLFDTFSPKFFWTGDFGDQLGLWTGADLAEIVGKVRFGDQKQVIQNRIPAAFFGDKDGASAGYLKFSGLDIPLDFLHRERPFRWSIGTFVQFNSIENVASDLMVIGAASDIDLFISLTPGGQVAFDLGRYNVSSGQTDPIFSLVSEFPADPVLLNTPIFLCFVCDGETLKFYYQAEPNKEVSKIGTGTPSGTTFGDDSIYIGASSTTIPSVRTKGKIHTAFVMDYPLKHVDIQKIWAAAKNFWEWGTRLGKYPDWELEIDPIPGYHFPTVRFEGSGNISALARSKPPFYVRQASVKFQGSSSVLAQAKAESEIFDGVINLPNILGYTQLDFAVYGGQQVMWQDMNRTIPVTQKGDPVAYVDDITGNGRDLYQPTNNLRPVWQGTGEGCLFTGTEFFNIAKEGFSQNILNKFFYGPFTYAIVANTKGNTDQMHAFSLTQVEGPDGQEFQTMFNVILPGRPSFRLRLQGGSLMAPSFDPMVPLDGRFVTAFRLKGQDSGDGSIIANNNQKKEFTDRFPRQSSPGQVDPLNLDLTFGAWRRHNMHPGQIWGNWKGIMHGILWIERHLTDSEFNNIVAPALMLDDAATGPPTPTDGDWESTLDTNDLQFFTQLDFAVYDGNQVLWQDVERTIPVEAPGDPIAYVDDLTGNGFDLYQPTAGNRPTWNGTGLGASFDGNQYLRLNKEKLTAAVNQTMIQGPSTMLLAIDNEGAQSQHYLVGLENASSGDRQRLRVYTNVASQARLLFESRDSTGDYQSAGSYSVSDAHKTEGRSALIFANDGNATVKYYNTTGDGTFNATYPDGGTYVAAAHDLGVGVWSRFGGWSNSFTGTFHAFGLVSREISAGEAATIKSELEGS